MSSIPVEVIIDILLRLPAKSLLRFKCVCKLWHHIINGSDFIRLHFQQSNNLHIVISTPILHLIEFDTFANPTALDHPCKNEDNFLNVDGSCHGLLCISESSTVFLYNPTTRTHKILPNSPFNDSFCHTKGIQCFGFGYDHVSQDYKCVRILQRWYNGAGDQGFFKSRVMVYSLKEDSWKLLAHDRIPYFFGRQYGNCVHLEGVLHWLLVVDAPIIGFNIGDETFSTVSLPNHHNEKMRAHMGVIDDCLCLMLNFLYCCDVWIMKEYGISASWTKLFRLSKQEIFEEFKPISFSMSKKQLFVSLVFYDVASVELETLETTIVQLPGFRNKIISAHVCPENLLMFKDAEDVLAINYISVDVITDILLRLPAKSLLRFKCVCKLWHNIINGSDFIRRHFQQSNNLHIVISTPILHLIEFDSFANPTELDYPYKNQEDLLYVYGSCHGLLCISTFGTVFLYNPTTRTHKVLPKSPFDDPSFCDSSESFHNYGFGYDHVSQDYKCVSIVQSLGDDDDDEDQGLFKSQVMVYSLKEDSWKLLDHDLIPYFFYGNYRRCVPLEGILHWLYEEALIVAFNFGDETFSTVSLPNHHTEISSAHIGLIDDCLCLVLECLCFCDVWIMKYYGISASWTKLFRLPIQEMFREFKPISFSMSKKKLFVSLLYNLGYIELETLKTTIFQLPGFRNKIYSSYVCPENLLML